MTKHKCRKKHEVRMTNGEMVHAGARVGSCALVGRQRFRRVPAFRHSCFVLLSTFVLRHSSFLLAAPPEEVAFRLDNGLRVLLIRQAEHPVTVVALGVGAGVYTEPEGRCGISHLAEHLFWYGASKSFGDREAFDALARTARSATSSRT